MGEQIKKYWLYGLLSLLGIIILGVVITIAVYFLYIIPKQASDKLAFDQLKWTQEQIDKQKIEDEKKAKEKAVEEAKQDAAINLEQCLTDAGELYRENWIEYCSVWKKEVKDTYNDCKSRFDYLTAAEAKKYCWTNTPDYTTQEENGMCLLPTKYSKNVEDQLKESKDECYKKYPIK